MEFIIGLFLAAKSLALLTGIFMTGSKEGAVLISKPNLYIKNNQIMFSCETQNVINKDLREFILSGTPVKIEYEIFLIQYGRENQEESRQVIAIEYTVEYDLVKQNFRLFKNQDCILQDKSYEKIDGSLSQPKDIALINQALIESDKYYVLSVKIALGKIKIEGLKNKEIDLISFWNYHKPYLETQPFLGQAILSVK